MVNQSGFVKFVTILSKIKKPIQEQLNNTKFYLKFRDLDSLCPIEWMLISQFISFMIIVAKMWT